ncbi:hypothetical protein [Candidatus Oscillochloris fontis]|uniref:hypothetical protein n=1 Tax=Candidatus Oscillochloris fontis TaxID=2496868 RepID=UPI00101C4A48|nr:hypothetical protein [Candidatus Oscillochloris fontis]
MDLFVNDLSLHGQFGDYQAFRRSLDDVLACRTCAANYQRTLRVPRSIIERQVTPQADFRQAVQANRDRNFVMLIMEWLNKRGPFVEDDLLRNPNEYLALSDDTLVTDEAIGEAATRHFQGLSAGLISFAPSTYQHTPISVHWHHDDGSVESCALPNCCEPEQLQCLLESYRQPPESWNDFIAQLPGRFPHLTFLPGLEDYLKGTTFSPYLVERSFVLLDVLNRLKTCFDAEGQRTAAGEELIDNFFRRDKALFSDSSDSEKNDPVFRNAMTFKDPDGHELICFWHGKVKRPIQFRIHFSYPIQSHTPLYVAYIGEKLTKK